MLLAVKARAVIGSKVVTSVGSVRTFVELILFFSLMHFKCGEVYYWHRLSDVRSKFPETSFLKSFMEISTT